MAQSGSDSLRSALADGSDSFKSTLAGGSDSLTLALADGSDSYMSTLAGGNDSFRSALEGGHDFMFENCCDLCEQDGLQKEAVGFCANCQDYLCTECFRNHVKPKPLRHHVLLDQHQMPNRESTKTRIQHVMDIKVRSRDDSYTSRITGCVVLPGDKLVVVDYKNNNVKLIDLTHNKIVSQLKLSGTLWNITQVGSTPVAVTSPNTQTIHVVNVSTKTLKLDHTIKVKGQCLGIASINDKLVVSYDEPLKVELINMTGQVLRTVVTENKGRELFTNPWHVAVNRLTIYISDWNRYQGTVTSVDLTGQVKATYKNNKLWSPYGFTLDNAGRVCVCVRSSRTILQLTVDLTELRELPLKSDGVVDPTSVYCCNVTDRLYIGTGISDVVKVYQLE